MHDFDNLIMESASKLQAILDSPDDQIAPRASSLLKPVIHSTQSFFVGTPNSTQRFSSCGSQVKVSSNSAYVFRNDITDLAIIDSSVSHSSPPALASSHRISTPARRWRCNSNDILRRIDGTGDIAVPSRVRHLNAESNVQTRITKFQRNADAIAPRASSNPVTKGQPLVLGPLQPHPTDTPTTLALPSHAQFTSVDKGLMQRLETLQQYFDQ